MSDFDRLIRDNKIFNLHKSGKTNKEISKIYGLKVSTVEKIIKKEYKRIKETEFTLFIHNLQRYAESNYSKMNATIIYHSLWRYVKQHFETINKDMLLEAIDNKVIRGIGDKSISIIHEYIESTK